MLVVVLNTFRYSRYLLVPERNAIHLVLHAEAQPRDMVQAYLQVRCRTDNTVWASGCLVGCACRPFVCMCTSLAVPSVDGRPAVSLVGCTGQVTARHPPNLPQACILRKCLKTGHSLSPDNLPELRIILHDTLLAAENLTPPFMRALARQGWQTEKIVVEAHRRRARW